MNEQELKNKLKEEFTKIKVPDIKDKIKAKYYFSKDSEYVPEKKKSKLRMLSNSLALALSSFIIVLAVIIISKSGIPSITNNYQFENESNLITFEAFSSVSLMPTTTTASLVNTIGVTNIIPLASQTENNNNVDRIHKYILLAEQLLTLNNGLNVTTEDSDIPEYSNKEIINITSALDQTLTYTFYYNLTPSEDQVSFSLEGIMRFNNLEYQLIGRKVVNENNSNVSFKATFNENTWVEVEQKKDGNNEKYEYTISDNGIITNSNVKIVNNNNKLSVDIDYSDDSSTGNYHFTQEIENNQKNIKIQVKEGKITENFKVSIVTDENTGEEMYEYKNTKSNESVRKDNEKNKKDDNNNNGNDKNDNNGNDKDKDKDNKGND